MKDSWHRLPTIGGATVPNIPSMEVRSDLQTSATHPSIGLHKILGARRSFILYWGDLERQLRSLVFLSLNDGGGDPRSPPPNLRNIVWETELELPDESNQERVHLDDAGKSRGTLDFPQGMNR